MNEIIQQIKAHARQAQIQPQFAKDQAWEIEQLAEALQARANERIEALQADNAKLRDALERVLSHRYGDWSYIARAALQEAEQ